MHDDFTRSLGHMAEVMYPALSWLLVGRGSIQFYSYCCSSSSSSSVKVNSSTKAFNDCQYYLYNCHGICFIPMHIAAFAET